MGANIKAKALAASDSVPGHLCVTGGRSDVMTNRCLLMGPGVGGASLRGVKEKQGGTEGKK